MTFNVLPIFVEVGMVLIIFVTMFSWEFCLIQLFSIIAYVAVTYCMTEAQASKFKAKN